LKRLCIVTSTFPRWPDDPIPAFVYHLAQDLGDLGWEVEVLAPHAPGAATGEMMDGICVTRFRYMWPEALETVAYGSGIIVNLRKHPTNILKLPFFLVCQWLALRRLLRRGRFDVLNAHWVLPQGLIGVLAAGGTAIPTVITVHGGDVMGLRGSLMGQSHRGGLIGALKRAAFSRAAAITVNSSATEDAARVNTGAMDRIERIPMGATLPAPRPTVDKGALEWRQRCNCANDGQLVVFVGRLVVEKGVDDLIRAMALVAPDMPDITLLVVGDGQDRGYLEDLARQLDVTKRVHFAGWLGPEALADVLAAADIFAGPSKTRSDGWVEGLGLTFVEAMLAGLPVLATRSGGIVDLITDGQTGLTVAENDPEGIAEAIGRLVDDPGLCQRLAANAKAHAQAGFTRAVAAQKFDTLFSAVAARQR
jgi:glycosyltransferase involved in cell wall biosynthesis